MRACEVEVSSITRAEALSAELDAALDELVDSSDRWLDVPFALMDSDLEAYDELPPPLRAEFTCGFCGSMFWPIETTMRYDGKDYVAFGSWCYYQAGYWFGRSGEGHHFPVCSDGCHDALERRLEKRRIHTAAQMESIGRARRLIKECRATVKRVRAESKAC